MKKYKVKIKLRYLVFIILTVLLLIPGAFYLVGSTMIKMNGDFIGKSKRYYGAACMEIYSKMPKVTSNSGKVYFDIATGYYNVISDIAGYANYYKTIENLGNKERLNKSIENYKKGISLGEYDEYYAENLSMLINTLVASGNKVKAVEYIEKAKEGSTDRIRKVGIINEIILLAKDGELEEAIELCKSNKNDVEFDILYLNLIYNYGDANKFNSELEYRVDKIEEDNSKLNEGDYNPYMNYDEEGIYNIFLYKDVDILEYVDYKCSITFKLRSEGQNLVEGIITKKDVGIPYQRVEVGINSSVYADYRKNVGNWILDRATYTDDQGNYRIENMPNGSYNYEVSVQGYLMDNAYMYEKNKVEGWTFGFQINNSNEKKDFEIKEYVSMKDSENLIQEESDWLIFNFPNIGGAKKVQIMIEDEGSGFSYIGELEAGEKVKIPLLDGSFIIKNFYTNVEGNYGYNCIANTKDKNVSFGFSFYDENNNLINKTVPGEIEYTAKGKKLNTGDELMISGEYDKAVEWYDNQINENGATREYLYPLLNYYGGAVRDIKNTSRDYEKFNKYYDMLKELDITYLEVDHFEGILGR